MINILWEREQGINFFKEGNDKSGQHVCSSYHRWSVFPQYVKSSEKQIRKTTQKFGNGQVTEKSIQMTLKHMKRCSTFSYNKRNANYNYS